MLGNKRLTWETAKKIDKGPTEIEISSSAMIDMMRYVKLVRTGFHISSGSILSRRLYVSTDQTNFPVLKLRICYNCSSTEREVLLMIFFLSFCLSV